MEALTNICPMAHRRYEEVPIAKVKVINSRNLANVTRHRPKILDRDAMLLWIRNRKEAGQSITFSDVCFENRDYALAIKREFRSWARALQAAFPPQESSAE